MRTSITLLAGLATIVSATSVNFTMFAAGLNTQFWDLPLNAHGGGFWVFRPVSQQCPHPEKTHCTISGHTVIHGDDAGGPISLGSMVPGGQDIFIAKDGALGYMKANSSILPEGATRNPKGFTFVKSTTRWNDLGRLWYSGGNFTICGPEEPDRPAYQLFIDDGKNKLPEDICTPIQVGVRHNTVSEQVWSYD